MRNMQLNVYAKSEKVKRDCSEDRSCRIYQFEINHFGNKASFTTVLPKDMAAMDRYINKSSQMFQALLHYC